MFSTIASIAGPLIGASMMSGAASDAAGIQANATNNATAATTAAQNKATNELARQFNLGRSDLAPYRATGAAGLDALRQLIGLTITPGTPLPGQPPAAAPEGLRSRDEWIADNYRGGVGVGGLANLSPDAGYADYVQRWNDRNPGGQGGQVAAQPDVPVSASVDQNSPLLRKFSISDFWNDPVVQASYQSGLDLGTKALKNAAPLTTGLDSGAALKELTKFGTDYTGNMAGGSQARFVGDQSNTFAKLMALVNGGQGATTTTVNAGANTAGNIAGTTMAGGTSVANLISGQGNAAGAAKIAGANAFSGGLSSISNWWNQQQMLNRLTGGGAFGGGGAMSWNSTGGFPTSSDSANV